jgi:hypothetical protein
LTRLLARAGRGVALLILACGIGAALAGCGKSEKFSPGALRLQREDMTAVARALERVEGSVGTEVASTKLAWPFVVNGLPADPPQTARARIAAASASAAKITPQALFEEAQARSITGPASEVAGLYRDYVELATRGWALLDAAVEQIEHGSPASARFARENMALYIESIYDGNFILAQVGKHALDDYRKLGGPAAFGATLTQTEVDRLVQEYSEATDRLHPHTGVRLGS